MHCEQFFLLHQLNHEPCVSRMILFGEAKIYPLLSIVNKNIKCFVFENFRIFTNISPVHFSSFEHCEHSLANVERMPPVVVFHLFCWNIFYDLGKFIFSYFCPINHTDLFAFLSHLVLGTLRVLHLGRPTLVNSSLLWRRTGSWSGSKSKINFRLYIYQDIDQTW